MTGIRPLYFECQNMIKNNSKWQLLSILLVKNFSVSINTWNFTHESDTLVQIWIFLHIYMTIVYISIYINL